MIHLFGAVFAIAVASAVFRPPTFTVGTPASVPTASSPTLAACAVFALLAALSALAITPSVNSGAPPPSRRGDADRSQRSIAETAARSHGPHSAVKHPASPDTFHCLPTPKAGGVALRWLSLCITPRTSAPRCCGGRASRCPPVERGARSLLNGLDRGGGVRSPPSGCCLPRRRGGGSGDVHVPWLCADTRPLWALLVIVRPRLRMTSTNTHLATGSTRAPRRCHGPVAGARRRHDRGRVARRVRGRCEAQLRSSARSHPLTMTTMAGTSRDPASLARGRREPRSLVLDAEATARARRSPATNDSRAPGWFGTMTKRCTPGRRLPTGAGAPACRRRPRRASRSPRAGGRAQGLAATWTWPASDSACRPGTSGN